VAVGRVRGMFDPLLEAIPNLGVLMVLLVGSIRLEHGAMRPGDLVQVAFLFTLLAWPVRALGWVLAELPRSVVGWQRVRKVLDATGSLPYGTGTLDGVGAVSLDVCDVRFGYREPILREVSFHVPAGRTVAVVGPTGSGKSTLTSLLVRLIDPTGGRVLLDGLDVRDIRKGGVAAVAALVPQQTFLFDDTVRGNITLGADVPDEEVWAALRTAQADGFVAALPHGLDTRLGERGTTLSGGQRQRLSLARALVRNPRLLVMDDATSAVDPEVEARILAALRGSAGSGSATVVVVAYRKATIALADEVVYLRDGRVADQGTHAELLARNPGYADLVNAYEQEQSGEVTVP
ncbi:MAG: ABC transporter ATP-binding protein, partial [Nocardioidaceae bacterium]